MVMASVHLARRARVKLEANTVELDPLPGWAIAIPDDVDAETLLYAESDFKRVPDFQKFTLDELHDYGQTTTLSMGKRAGCSYLQVADDWLYCAWLSAHTSSLTYHYYNSWYSALMGWKARELLAHTYLNCKFFEDLDANAGLQLLKGVFLEKTPQPVTQPSEDVDMDDSLDAEFSDGVMRLDFPMFDVAMHKPDETDESSCWSSYNVKPPPINVAFLSHLAELPG